MPTTLEQLSAWLGSKESEHLEFKEAKQQFDFASLKRYVVALGNEGGGHLVLGVSPKLPRRVVGTQAFRDTGNIKRDLYDSLRVAVGLDELVHPDGRVLVFEIPGRPLGSALQLDGAYLMRAGESVVPMPPDRLRAIFAEAVLDYSAEPTRATLADVSPAAFQKLVELWVRKTGEENHRTLGVGQTLEDLGLVEGDRLRLAALVLLGTKAALRRELACAELVYEYRTEEPRIEHDFRKEWRVGFLEAMDELWAAIEVRTNVMHFHEGLFVRDIPVVRESVVREALLNAVSHRDYRSAGSIFVRQWPQGLRVESPGGLPTGITVENMLVRQLPRNRLIADTLRQLGLVERSGQGMDRMVRSSVLDGKLPPDFRLTDAHHVFLTLHGLVSDSRFVRYLEKLGAERLARFHPLDFVVLDHLHRQVELPALCRDRVGPLIEAGAIERVGSELLLSKALYTFLGERGRYSRAKGLDREAQKELLVQHLREVAAEDGAALEELRQVLGAATPTRTLQRLLQELRREGRLVLQGKTRSARWRIAGPS